MKEIKISIVVLLSIFLTACTSKNNKEADESQTEVSELQKDEPSVPDKQWTYKGETGPDHWAEIDTNYCDGKAQSPIDIIDAVVSEDITPIDIHYNNATKIHDVTNNGHSIQYNFSEGDYINVEGKKYSLKQFHFHEPAEHTIKGVRYPIVLHLAHMSADNEYAVIALLGEEKSSNNPVFEFLNSYLPLQVDEKKEINESFNMNSIFPEDKSYFTYTGSLTTPPCTENVKWFVMQQALPVSNELISTLQEIMPINNYRKTQPLNGRTIWASN
ncbi:carbonic anhydrase [Fulvivirga sediminis]|uniref:carbonic anhydrase n=1 Tax=Fulvivirga sediminis TaxID=2803949 RepID=A0A937K169_9BACT|nr:carbonic anhydrase family protein [Fulvivirga sediminis]MBL3656352.1 carbonic anhydrase family protein [Fulvivirga sediminis]